MKKRKGIYTRLAISNLKNNSKLYVPFILLSIVSVVMFYTMFSLGNNDSLDNTYGGDTVKNLLYVGGFVAIFMALIFILYANNFVIDRRKKDFGLYNVLGMEKRHIAKLLFIENMFLMIITIVVGILIAIAINNVTFKALGKAMNTDNTLEWTLNTSEIIITIVVFVSIFIFLSIVNLFSLNKVNPAELFSGNAVGDLEPKSKGLVALIGIVSLGIAYYMLVCTTDFLNLFIAFILIIVATKLLFTSGIIILLKRLKKNKKFYYKTRNFISVSNLIHRIKRNASGLSNICILSTMVIIIASAGMALYFGGQENLKKVIPDDVVILTTSKYPFEELIKKANDTTNLKPSERKIVIGDLPIKEVKDKIEIDDNMVMPEMMLNVLTQDEYNRLSGANVSLNEDECVLFKGTKYKDEISIQDKTFKCVDIVEKDKIDWIEGRCPVEIEFIVLKDEDTFKKIYEEYIPEENRDRFSETIGLSFEGESDDNIKKYSDELTKLYKEIYNDEEASLSVSVQNGVEAKQLFMEVYAGMFFIAVFLVSLFLIITALVIYYKQLSEGYEDKDKFIIMQKVGMDKKGVKKSIISQVRLVFCLPIVMMIAHVMALMKLLFKYLKAIGLMDHMLYIKYSFIAMGIFFVVYFIIYKLTEKEYFRIVNFD